MRYLDFWSLALQLKRLRRTGWIDRGVSDPESSADHSWGVALLAWLLARDYPDLDRERVLLLGLIHDLPEAVAGDATPFDHLRDATGVIASDHFTSHARLLRGHPGLQAAGRGSRARTDVAMRCHVRHGGRHQTTPGTNTSSRSPPKRDSSVRSTSWKHCCRPKTTESASNTSQSTRFGSAHAGMSLNPA